MVFYNSLERKDTDPLCVLLHALTCFILHTVTITKITSKSFLYDFAPDDPGSCVQNKCLGLHKISSQIQSLLIPVETLFRDYHKEMDYSMLWYELLMANEYHA